MNAISMTSPAPENLSFKPIQGADDARWAVVTQVYKTVLEPLCGSQEDTLKEIQSGNDRQCHVLYEKETAIGLVVYKNKTTNEFGNHGIWKSLEIKLLCLAKPSEQSRHGYGTELLKKAEGAARQMGAEALHVRVSEEALSALQFFQKKGFKIAHTFEKGKKEYLLTKNLEQIRAASGEGESKLVNSSQGMNFRKRKASIKDGGEYSAAKRQKTDASSKDRVERIPLKKHYLNLIANGEKTVEGRICNSTFKKLEKGKKMTFFCTGQPDVRCEVTEITRYESFREMLEKEGVSACLGKQVTSLEEGVKIYDSIPGYSQKAKAHGVLGIRLKLLD